MNKTATATIDLQALRSNFKLIQTLAPKSQILAVLKANAYGHGLERIAKALPMADAFGVARIDEALALRAGGVVKPIVLLEGFFDTKDIPILAVNNLQTVIHNRQQLDALLQCELEKPIKVWLKIDTGMHRLGIEPEDFLSFYQPLVESKNIASGIVLMSHLGCADEVNNSKTTEQIALFNTITQHVSEQRSLANSAAVVAWESSQYDWVRPGLMLYGVSPLQVDNHQALRPLTPVMTLTSSLISIRNIEAGESVGYGGAWVSDKATTIGVIAIGYGDGYPRHAVNGTPVLLNNRIVPLIGRVSMDMITVDLGADCLDKVGDIATLWGKGLPVEQVAKYATTIPYELLCNITRRVQINTI